MTPIQATFGGCGGRAVTLFSAYDENSRILVISIEKEYRTERHENCAVITNLPEIPRDSLFMDQDLPEAVAAFFQLKNGVAADDKTSRLVFSENASRANPETVIEQDGLDASGKLKFRVSEAVTSAHMAALATCLYAARLFGIESSVRMADDLARLSHGEAITI